MPTEDWESLRARIVLWEDPDVLVVNKPSGLSVMGERHATDLVRIAADAGEDLRWVHRIDKVTSGAVVLAKHQKAHAALTRQFAKRTVEKGYLAICHGTGLPERATIDLPLLTAGSGRIRVAAERQHIGYDEAAARWSVTPENLLQRKSFPSTTDVVRLHEALGRTLVLAKPVTGRRHQIRVHLAWTGHAIVGDPLFTRKTDPVWPRTHLHALRIGFTTPAARPRWQEVTAVPDETFWTPLTRTEPPGAPVPGPDQPDLSASAAGWLEQVDRLLAEQPPIPLPE